MKNVLIIRYKRTQGVMDGGEQGSEKNLRVINSIFGVETVDTVYIHEEGKKRKIGDYVDWAVGMARGYFFGLTKKRTEELVEKAKEYPYVFVDRSVFGVLAKRLKESGYNGRIICFFHNVEKVYFGAKCKWYYPWSPVVIRCADKNDRWSCEYADKVIALNERDNDILYSLYGRRADILVPVAFKDVYADASDEVKQRTTAAKPVCVFLGSYFRANVDGLQWFFKNVYPQINARMIVAGKGMSKIREEGFVPDDVEVRSDVEDLRALYEEADCMVMPIFDGSGMKVKTCEALMYAKNIIAAPEALVGYEVDYEKIGARCDNAEEFVNAINYLAEHPRKAYNEYSRKIYTERYSEDAVMKTFEKVFR